MIHAALTLFMQLLLFAAANAAPTVTTATHPHIHTWHYGVGGGVISFIVLILDLIVFMEVLQSNRSVPGKVLWCLLVFLFPIGGMIIYWLFSNRRAHARGYETIA